MADIMHNDGLMTPKNSHSLNICCAPIRQRADFIVDDALRFENGAAMRAVFSRINIISAMRINGGWSCRLGWCVAKNVIGGLDRRE
jgi:hypothetical protein